MMMPSLLSIGLVKRTAAAFALGAVMVLCMPPVGAFPILLLCVPGFIFLARGAETKARAFLTGWAFGAGYFIFGLYWISAALFVDIKQWGWVMPLSLVVGPALYGLYYGFIPLLAWRCRERKTAHAVATVAAWAIIEWLRGHLFTGFPWNLAGSAWMHDLPVMQVSAYAGIYGLSLLTLLWAAIPAFIEKRRMVGIVGASFILVTLLGMARLHLHPLRLSSHTLRIVQPDIAEKDKWSNEDERLNLEKQLQLTQTATPVDFVIWPETAVTADLESTPGLARHIAASLPPGSFGILGALRIANEGRSFYNNVSVLNGKAEIVASYDKHHLVPFGEYIPFRGQLNLTPIALAISNLGDFSRGPGPQTLRAGNLPPFSPLICYEVIFPHEVVKRKDRPDWLVNVTNDGWYGLTAGPYQHFETARARAIEEGLPLARAANTGISGVIDPLGRVLAEQPLGTTGALETLLPAALPPTPYAKWGDIPFLLMFALTALWAEGLRRKA